MNPISIGETDVGELVLPGGGLSHFRFDQPRPRGQHEDLDMLDIDLPGGEHLHWEIPVDQSKEYKPDFAARPSRGSYTAARDQVSFVLGGGPDTFTWLLGDEHGLSGQFVLNPDFSGQGQALRNGRLEFVGRWDTRAHMTLLLADGSAAVAGPSAGAQDFGDALVDHYIALLFPVKS